MASGPGPAASVVPVTAPLRYLHVFAHPARFEEEVHEAGLRVETVWRDQRAYDRSRGQIRGYAILVAPHGPVSPQS